MKVLIIRFSSIGDILVTTPIVRCIKMQLKAEVHYLCKKGFEFAVSSNPFIDQILSSEKNLSVDRQTIKAGAYDIIIDLQKNLYTIGLTTAMGIKTIRYQKLNIEKWLYVQFKWKVLPSRHLIDRYFDALKSIGVENDGEGMDYLIHASTKLDLPQQYDVIVLGAAHKTKRIPVSKIVEIVNAYHRRFILIGGKDVEEEGQEIASCYAEKCLNFCGKTSFDETAYIVKNANHIFTGDTGIMHLAAALKKNITVLWGNTTPEFGLFPYYGAKNAMAYESKEVKLGCRPCSKLGFDECPKGHFNCMMKQEV